MDIDTPKNGGSGGSEGSSSSSDIAPMETDCEKSYTADLEETTLMSENLLEVGEIYVNDSQFLEWFFSNNTDFNQNETVLDENEPNLLDLLKVMVILSLLIIVILKRKDSH